MGAGSFAEAGGRGGWVDAWPEDAVVAFATEALDDGLEGYGALVAFAADAEGDGASLGLAVADDEHVGDFSELGVADFGVHAFVAVVDFDAEAVGAEGRGDFVGVGLVAVGDGDDDRLCRCEPEGEVAFVFFDEEGDHAFHGGDDPAVNDDGAMAGAIFADVFEAELAGEVEVDLDGSEGFFFALGGGELDVDLGAVEGGFAFGGEVLEAEAVEDATEEGFAFFPHVGVVDVFFVIVGVAEGEAVAVVAEAEDAVGVFHELEDAFDFLLDHGRVGAEDVGVVEGHDANAAHAGDLSAFFPAMHVAEFGDADGEFAVGVELGGEDEDVGGAVHGAEDVFFAFALHDGVHGVVEVVPVA